MDLYCFLHEKERASAYCKNCLRPICASCASLNDGVCLNCLSFKYNLIIKRFKPELIWTIIFLFFRLTIGWDIIASFISLDLGFFDLLYFNRYQLIILGAFFIYFLIKMIRFGIKGAFIDSFTLLTDPDVIKHHKITFWGVFFSIIIFIFLVAGTLIFSYLAIIFNIIHLISLIKHYNQAKKIIKKDIVLRKMR